MDNNLFDEEMTKLINMKGEMSKDISPNDQFSKLEKEATDILKEKEVSDIQREFLKSILSISKMSDRLQERKEFRIDHIPVYDQDEELDPDIKINAVPFKEIQGGGFFPENNPNSLETILLRATPGPSHIFYRIYPKRGYEKRELRRVQNALKGIFKKYPEPEEKTLPVRNHCQGIQGHIECLKDSDLIHGCIVHTKKFDLICKAYRFFEWTGPWLNGEKTAFRNYDAVSGSCMQKYHHVDEKGQPKVVHWSPAKILKDYYKTTYPLLPPGIAMRHFFKKNQSIGHYFVVDPVDRIYENICNLGLKENPEYMDFHDNGIPMQPFLYGTGPSKATADFHSFLHNPRIEENPIENALFNELPEEPGQGFALNTPYIKIFSPCYESDQVVVMMRNAYRLLVLEKGLDKKTFRREDEWVVKTFS
jgi:hypothetical protein